VEQGTIRDFDEKEHTGTLLTDGRAEVVIDADPLDASGILTLRIGQRVKFETEERDGATVARSLRIVTWE
jgi:cold shock CspA family protein